MKTAGTVAAAVVVVAAAAEAYYTETVAVAVVAAAVVAAVPYLLARLPVPAPQMCSQRCSLKAEERKMNGGDRTFRVGLERVEVLCLYCLVDQLQH